MAHKSNNNHNAVLEAWEVVSRYRWRFIIPAFLVTSTVLGVSLFLPRKYKAQATFEKRTDMVLTEMSAQGATRNFQDPRAATIEEIVGQPALDQLLTDIQPKLEMLGIAHGSVDQRLLRQNIEHLATIKWDISSGNLDRIRVQYTASNPQLAKIVVNTLVANYIQRQRVVMDERLNQSAGFFKQEAVRNRDLIETLENQRLAFEIKHADLLPENPNNVQVQISDSQDARAMLIASRDAAAIRAATIKSTLEKEPETVEHVLHGKNPDLDYLESDLRKLRAEEANYVGFLKMRDAHPDLIALRQQIQAVKQTIAKAPREVVSQRQELANPKRTELELRLSHAQSEHQALIQQLVSLDKQRAELDGDAATMFEVRSAYRKINRDVEQAQRQVTFWEDNLRRVDLALAADAGDKGVELDFIRPAQASTLPVSPNFVQVLMAAVGLGLLAGGLNVFFTHRTNESFSDGEKAASAMELTLIGAVSEIVTVQHRRIRRMRNMVLYPANAIVMGSVLLGFGSLLYLDLQQPRMLSDFKSTATSLVAPQTAQASVEPVVVKPADADPSRNAPE